MGCTPPCEKGWEGCGEEDAIGDEGGIRAGAMWEWRRIILTETVVESEQCL